MAEGKKVNFKRETAKKHLEELVKRVETINKDKKSYMKVSDLYVFGSYLQGTSTVHDLDIFIDIKETPYCWDVINKQYNGDRVAFFLDYADKSDRNYSSFEDRLFWCLEDYLRKIKASSRVISLHDMHDYRTLSAQPDFKYVKLIENYQLNKEYYKDLMK